MELYKCNRPTRRLVWDAAQDKLGTYWTTEDFLYTSLYTMTTEFFQASQQGDVAVVRQHLEQNPALAGARGTYLLLTQTPRTPTH